MTWLRLLALLSAFSCQTSFVSSWTVDFGRRQTLSGGLGVAVALATGAVVGKSDPAWALSDLSDFQPGPQGLQYKILQQGQGQPPVRGQQVNAKYTLWTGGFGEDGGKQVDSNTGFLGRPLPVIVGIGRVIKGWDLTLLNMKVGEIRRIVVPSDIGYGDGGAGGSIPPKATLYFQMEITDIDSLPQLMDEQKKWLEDNPL
jgi:hypothetical protein